MGPDKAILLRAKRADAAYHNLRCQPAMVTPCPRRPPAKSACLEGPILEAHIVPLFVPVLAGFLQSRTGSHYLTGGTMSEEATGQKRMS